MVAVQEGVNPRIIEQKLRGYLVAAGRNRRLVASPDRS